MATPIPDNRAELRADDVARATAGVLVTHGRDLDVLVGVTTDSRVVSAGRADVFVPLVGEKMDGHSFLDRIDGVAKLVVCARGRGRALTKSAFVEVDDTLTALGAIAAHHLERLRASDPKRRVVAVTGSAGKTTTKELTAALLATNGVPAGEPSAIVQKTRGNLNNRIGMPSTVLTVTQEHTYVVLEVGMSVPGEIAAMAEIARPDVAIVTNIGVAHSEGVGGREGVAREKGDLFAGLDPHGTAIVNADCDMSVREVRRSKGARAVTFGRAPEADYRLVERRVDGVRGSEVRISRPYGEIAVSFELLGEHAAIDLCAALAAAEVALGRALTRGEIEGAVARTELSGRGQLVVLGNGALLVDDSYNANPQSMDAALSVLRELGEGRRKVAVLGEMRELGALADEEHVRLGARAVAAGVDVMVSCGGLISRVADATRAAGVPTFEYMSAEDAATFVTSHIDSSDIVLVKGSRSITTEKVVAALVAAYGRRVASGEVAR